MAVNPIPEGYHTVTPYLIVDDPDGVISFAREAFGATEQSCMRMPDGSVMHAEVQIGDSRVMLGGANAQWPARPSMLFLYVEDVDATFQQALAAGATSVMEPADQFWGDRHGGVQDPSGNQWWISTHVEDVAPDEMQRRSEAYIAEHAAAAEAAAAQ